MSDPIKNWLASFPAEAARERLGTLERNRIQVDAEIEDLRRWLGVVEPSGNQVAEANPAATPEDGPRGMAAVEAVMGTRPGHVWTRREIAHSMVERGYLSPGEPGRRTLGSTLHRMVAAGRVLRVDTARYSLPTERQEVLAA